MKVSDLTIHTSQWLGIPHTTVAGHARALRLAGHLPTGPRGPGAPEVTVDHAVALLVSVCGISTASAAGDHVATWLGLRPIDHTDRGMGRLVGDLSWSDALGEVLTDLVVSGPLNRWLCEYGPDTGHLTVDHDVDQYLATLIAERRPEAGGPLETVQVVYAAPSDRPWPTHHQPAPGAPYQACSQLLRRLTAANLVGFAAPLWGSTE